MVDDEAKFWGMAILGLILFFVVLASPIGDLAFDLLGFIPGAAWKWIFGIGALIGLFFVIRWFNR